MADHIQIEEPGWLSAKVDQRLALMQEQMGDINMADLGNPFVLTPLTEPPIGASQRARDMWERTCDNCDKFCPGRFFTGMTQRKAFGVQVTFMYGACPACAMAV